MMHRLPGIILILGALLCLTADRASAQFFDENHPELEWQTITTEHFYVHFHQGEDRTPRLVAKISEEVWDTITSLYDYTPKGRVHWILRDHDDFSNGAAYYYEDRIELYAPPADFMLRGSSNWLRNVVTHEFTHMISMGRARKLNRKFPALFLQGLAYEDEAREDVLYGYPNVIISQPIAGTVIPGWFAEGTAQHGAETFGYDRYDAHRDMILRMRALEDDLLSLEEMSHFGKSSIGSESVYNQGYALVRYIVDTYGEEKLDQLMKAMKSFMAVNFNGALQKVLGIGANDLYNRWKQEMTSRYRRQIAGIESSQAAGRIIESKSAGNFYPSWSPDGKRVAFLSTGQSDYLSITGLYVHDIGNGDRKHLESGTVTKISWNHDGTRIVYAKNTRMNNGSHFNDLYLYDMNAGDETQLTRGERLAYPAFAPDGGRILCVAGQDGAYDLAVMDIASKDLQYLTRFNDGRQVYGGQWSPDGTTIAFATSDKHGRDIGFYDTGKGTYEYIMDGPEDTRDPAFSPDGRYLYYSSDRTGIFNIYRMDLQTRQSELMTNVIGGAFMPSVNTEGALIFALYTNRGFHLAVIDAPQPVPVENARYNDAYVSSIPAPDYDDRQQPDMPAEPYTDQFSNFMLVPRLMIDYGKPKLGFTGFGSTVLSDMDVITAATVNPDFDLDVAGIFEYRKLRPTLFVEFYHLTRHTSDGPDKIKLSLIEADAGASMRLWGGSEMRASYVHDRYSSSIDVQGDQNNVPFFFRSEYHIGHDFRLQWRWDTVRLRSDSEINPSGGGEIAVRVDRYINKFLDDFDLTKSFNVEVYKTYQYSAMELDWKQYFSLPGGTGDALTFGVQAAGLTENPDDFYYYYAGGLPGMKGYSYFSMQGSRKLIGSATWRRPIVRKMGMRLGPWYFTRMYGAVRFDYGNAWDAGKLPLDDFKRDIDLELRLDAFSWYNYPTRIAVNAAYGFNRFVRLHEAGIEGQEWKYYMTLLFEFL